MSSLLFKAAFATAMSPMLAAPSVYPDIVKQDTLSINAVNTATPAVPVEAAVPPPPPPFEDRLKSNLSSINRNFKQRVQAQDYSDQFNDCFARKSNKGLTNYEAKAVRTIRASYSDIKPDYTLAPIIVLDPGHGHKTATRVGYDTGATRGAYQEAKFIDVIVEPLAEELRTRLNAHVVTTRDPLAKGISLTSDYRFKNQEKVLQYRAELAYRLQKEFHDYPVIFISVHINAAPSEKMNGGEVFYSSTLSGSDDSAKLAKQIARNYRIGPNARTQVKSDDFAVLRCPRVAVLFEAGFITGATDFAALKAAANNTEKARHLASMMVDGVESFIENKRKEQGPAKAVQIAMAGKNPSGPQ